MKLSKVEGVGLERDLDLIFQVLDAVIPDGKGSYLAAPISTGRRYFQALARHRVNNLAGLIGAMGESEYLREVRWPNVREGEAVAEQLRARGVHYLVNTGPIFIDEWANEDYMKLCLDLIERKVRCVYFHPDWAFSSGAVQEFIFCAERGIRLLTSDGAAFDLAQGRKALEAVRSELSSLGLSLTRVDEQIDELDSLILKDAPLGFEQAVTG